MFTNLLFAWPVESDTTTLFSILAYSEPSKTSKLAVTPPNTALNSSLIIPSSPISVIGFVVSEGISLKINVSVLLKELICQKRQKQSIYL